MVAILFLCSIFLLPLDSEFVEASPASYDPEELGKSAFLLFFSRILLVNREFGGRGDEITGGEEEKSQGSLLELHVPLEERTGFFSARVLWGGEERKRRLCGKEGAGMGRQVNDAALRSAAQQTSGPGALVSVQTHSTWKNAAVAGSV